MVWNKLMKITIEINGETWTYDINNPDLGAMDFMDAVIPIESLLRAVYPSFGTHALTVVCPDGEEHDPEGDCEFIQEMTAEDPAEDKQKTEEVKEKGIDLPEEDAGGDKDGKKDE